jgi:hypothetical protein
VSTLELGRVVCAIDLAERCSAATIASSKLGVLLESCCSADNIVDYNKWFVFLFGAAPPGTKFVAEDVPPGRGGDLPAKGAYRNQGLLLATAILTGNMPIYWVFPNVWQRALGYAPSGRPARPTTKRWAKDFCEGNGYTPPEWARGSKALEDARDSWCISQWALVTNSVFSCS